MSSKYPKKIEIVLSVCLLLVLAHFLRFCFAEGWFNNNLAGFDWDQHFFYSESVRKLIVEYHQLPVWNPYYIGGIPLLENPQIKFFTPSTILSILFGGVLGLKLSIFLYYVLGVIGSVYLFRYCLRYSILVTIFSSILFLFSGWLTQHIFSGHSQFFSAPLISFLYAFLIRYRKTGKRKYLFFSSFTFALVLSDGNIYFFLYINLLSILFLLYFLSKKEYRTSLRIVLFLLVSILFSAYRLLPEMEYIFSYGAYFRKDHSFISLIEIWKIFTSTSQHPYLAKNFQNQEYNWWEYGNYISYVPFLIFLVMIPFMKKKDQGYLFLLCILLLFIAGDFHMFSPVSLFSYFPGYGNLRCHARWSYLFVFFFSVFLGRVLNRSQRFLNFKISSHGSWNWGWGKVFSIFLCVVTFYLYYDLTKKNSINFKDIFTISQSSIEMSNGSEFRTVPSFPNYGSESAMMVGILSNQSTKYGYENLLTSRSVSAIGEPDYRSEFYLTSGGNVTPLSWSPGRILFQIETDTLDRLVINQNYHPYWKSDSSLKLESWEDKISVVLPIGKSEFTLYYWSPFLGWGILLSAFALGLFLIPEKRLGRNSFFSKI